MRNLNLFLYSLGILFSLLFFSCSEDEDVFQEEQISNVPLLSEGEKAERLFFLYIVADNNLLSNVQSDLSELLAVSDEIPNDCYVLVFVDDNRGPRILRYFNNDGKGDYDTVHNFEREMASCNPVDMQLVFDWLEEYYPADNVDIVFWSHGTGWLYDDNRVLEQFSFGADNNVGVHTGKKRMYIEELASVLKSLKVKPDRILFDACFMQCVEVAYALRDCANWIIASPAEIPALGAPYDIILPLYFDSSVGVQSIIDAYKAAYDGSPTGVVLSAVRCNALQQLADATATVRAALMNIPGNDCDNLFSYLPGGPSVLKPNFFDMNSVMQKFLSKEDYVAWKKALDNAVPYKCASEKWYSEVLDRDYSRTDEDYVKTANSYSGISMYLPSVDLIFNTSFALLEWSRAVWE